MMMVPDWILEGFCQVEGSVKAYQYDVWLKKIGGIFNEGGGVNPFHQIYFLNKKEIVFQTTPNGLKH